MEIIIDDDNVFSSFSSDRENNLDQFESKGSLVIILLAKALSAEDASFRSKYLDILCSHLDEEVFVEENHFFDYRGKKLVRKWLEKKIIELRDALKGFKLEIEFRGFWELNCETENFYCGFSFIKDNEDGEVLLFNHGWQSLELPEPNMDFFDRIVEPNTLSVFLKLKDKPEDAQIVYYLSNWLVEHHIPSKVIECRGKTIAEILSYIQGNEKYVFLEGLNGATDYIRSIDKVEEYAESHQCSIVGSFDRNPSDCMPRQIVVVNEEPEIEKYAVGTFYVPIDNGICETQKGTDASNYVCFLLNDGLEFYMNILNKLRK